MTCYNIYLSHFHFFCCLFNILKRFPYLSFPFQNTFKKFESMKMHVIILIFHIFTFSSVFLTFKKDFLIYLNLWILFIRDVYKRRYMEKYDAWNIQYYFSIISVRIKFHLNRKVSKITSEMHTPKTRFILILLLNQFA